MGLLRECGVKLKKFFLQAKERNVRNWIASLEDSSKTGTLLALLDESPPESITSDERLERWNLIVQAIHDTQIEDRIYSKEPDRFGWYPCEEDPEGNDTDAPFFADSLDHGVFSETLWDAFLIEDVQALVEIMKVSNKLDCDYAAQMMYTYAKEATKGPGYNVQSLKIDDLKMYSDDFILLLDKPAHFHNMKSYLIDVLGMLSETKAIPKLIEIVKTGNREEMETHISENITTTTTRGEALPVAMANQWLSSFMDLAPEFEELINAELNGL
jgi:hypothetical protein